MLRIAKKYRGVIVPMITPFDRTGKIDLAAASGITEYLVSNGTSPFVLGTTGESASIQDASRPDFVATVVRATAGRSLTYAGISGTCLETSCDLAKRFFDIGIDAVVAHLPGYYPLTEDQMLTYYTKLADCCPGPLILYNIPSTTHMSIPLHIVEKLSHHPKICGLKDSERDGDRLEQAIHMWKDRADFSFLIGWAAKSTQGLRLGADGIVPSTGNIVPNLYRELYDAIVNGDGERAADLQQATDEISRLYQKDRTLGQSLAALKLIMQEIGLCEPYVLPPLVEARQSEQEYIRSEFMKHRIIRDTRI